MSERSARAVARVVITLSLLAALGAAAQPKVVVFNDWPAYDGLTPQDPVLPKELDQKVLVIPVVTNEEPWDPNNNAIPPAIKTDFENAAAKMNEFWVENSFGQISFQTTVLDRVYQMPRERPPAHRGSDSRRSCDWCDIRCDRVRRHDRLQEAPRKEEVRRAMRASSDLHNKH